LTRGRATQEKQTQQDGWVRWSAVFGEGSH
jgi:hypothetical protein